MKNKTAVVLGGGPAGCSAAIGLVRAGYQVTLLEARAQLMRRVCGSFLDSEALAHLRWLGVLDELTQAGASEVQSTKVCSLNGTSVVLPFLNKEERGMACHRSLLEDILLSSVRKSGADVLTGCRVLDLHRDFERDNWIVAYRKIEPTQTQLNFSSSPYSSRPVPMAPKVANISANVVVIATGRYSVGSYIPHKQNGGWYGWNALFRGVKQTAGEQSLHFFHQGYVGVLTYSNGESNVCGLLNRSPQDQISWSDVYSRVMTHQPSFAFLMKNAERLTDWKSVGPLPFSSEMRPSDGPLLAGDAAAVGDPFMGEGLGRALSAGAMIYQAVQAPDFLATYTRLWNEAFRQRLRRGAQIRVGLTNPFVFRVLWIALSSQGWLVRRLLKTFHRNSFMLSTPLFSQQRAPELSAKLPLS